MRKKTDLDFIKGKFTQTYIYPNFIIKNGKEERTFHAIEYIRNHQLNFLNYESKASKTSVKLKILFDGKEFITSIIERYNLTECLSYLKEIDRRIENNKSLIQIFSYYSPSAKDFKPTYKQAALYLRYLEETGDFIQPTSKKDWPAIAKGFSLSSGKELYEYYNGKLITQGERLSGRTAKRDLSFVIEKMLYDFPQALALAKKEFISRW